MPKLPDVIDVMLSFREEQVRKWQAVEDERQRAEFERLHARRQENPEEFMSWGDFIAQLKVDNPELAAKAGLSTPTAKIESDEELERKKREAAEIAKQFS